MSDAPTIHLASHPDEHQILVWHTSTDPLGLAIQLEDGGGEHSGHHMAIRYGWDVLEAWVPRLRFYPARQAITRGGHCHAFTWAPPLSFDENESLLDWCNELAAAAPIYDGWLAGNRAIRTWRRLAGQGGTPVVDLLGTLAYICYEAVARAINHLAPSRGYRVEPETFGPAELWHLTQAGRFRYRGVLLP